MNYLHFQTFTSSGKTDMNCLLIASTAAEIAPLLKELREKEEALPEKFDMDVMITGVGMTGTAYALTRQITLKRPDLVIQAGVAGCYEKKIRLGTVVVVKDDRIADEAVIDDNRLITMKELGLRPVNAFPYKNEWLKNTGKKLLNLANLPLVRGISINRVTTDKKIRKLFRGKFDPVAESMEGAALHLVCLSEKIPFLQLRAISNYVGERDKKKWKLKKAIRNLNTELNRILDNIYSPVIKEGS
jgi:futalosine hydrolase